MTGDKTMTTTGLEILERCYESGYRAYQANIGRRQCPFAKRSTVYKAWKDGWDDARHEYEDEPPAD
jgi:ribosome modulation factor